MDKKKAINYLKQFIKCLEKSERIDDFELSISAETYRIDLGGTVELIPTNWSSFTITGRFYNKVKNEKDQT